MDKIKKNLQRKFVHQNFKKKIIFAKNGFVGHYAEKLNYQLN